MATPLRVEFTNQNKTYGADQMWITMFVDPAPTPNVCFGGTSEKVSFTGPLNNSPCYQITDKKLAEGIDVYSATSLRFYVSLGNPMDTKAFVAGSTFFGAPTFTNPSDPNWNVRWDIFELTVSNPRSPDDLGDLSTINGYGIPMMIDTFPLPKPGASGKGQTTARSYAEGSAPYSNLELLMKTYGGYNNLGGVPATGIVTNGNNFLRLIGPPNGAFSPTLATGGPFPSLNFYLDKVLKNGVKTPIKDAGRISGHTWDLTASAAGTLTPKPAAKQMTLTGKIDGKDFDMTVDADSNVGQANAMYTFSSMVYQAPGTGSQNPGLHFKYDGKVITEADLITELDKNDKGHNHGKKALAEIYHDLFSAYCFGLVGNPNKVTGWTNSDYGNKSLNDMGSAGWVALAGDIGAGKVLLANVPLFSEKTGKGYGYHNDWAALLYASSNSVYGFAYSDFFQFPIGQHTYKTPKGDMVNSWRVTVLADPPM